MLQMCSPSHLGDFFTESQKIDRTDFMWRWDTRIIFGEKDWKLIGYSGGYNY
jgi:inner membrane protein involved in colicin E2 resistance